MRGGLPRPGSAVTVLLLLIVPLVAAVGAVAGNEINALTNLPGWLRPARDHPLRVAAAATVVAGVLGVVAWRVQQVQAARDSDLPVRPSVLRGGLMVLHPDAGGWVVDRAEETRALVEALTGRAEQGAGMRVVGLHGAGGFGKTVLYGRVCEHPDVRAHFGDRVFRLSLGRGAKSPAAIADKVNNLLTRLTGTNPGYTDPEAAGAELGRLLGELPRSLLALDDVWYGDQLPPFLTGGRACVRLISTRSPTLLPPTASTVKVDRMTMEQSEAVLLRGLEPGAVPTATVRDLLRVTGRWPLLLNLSCGFISFHATRFTDRPYAEAAAELLGLIEAAGPAAPGVSGVDYEPDADLDDSAVRRRIVRATIEAGTKLLPPGSEECFARLGIFAGSEAIPLPVVTALWSRAGGLDRADAHTLCHRLAGLSLVTVNDHDGVSLVLHDVIRDHLRRELGPDGVAAASRCLVDGLRQTLDHGGTPTPWWELRSEYALGHLIRHLIEAGYEAEARGTATDLRWIEARLNTAPNAPHADLVQMPAPDADLRAAVHVLGASTHLLSATDPAHSLVDVLYSRLAHVPLWRDQLAGLAAARTLPRLVNGHPLPDTPHPALERTLTSAATAAYAPAWSPDGRQLAALGHNGAVRVWNPVTGEMTHVLTPDKSVRWMAWSPDGCFIASLSGTRTLGTSPEADAAAGSGWGLGGTAQVWDLQTGSVRTLGHDVLDLIWSPESTHLLTRNIGLNASLWDAATGTSVCTLRSPGGPLMEFAWSPSGERLAVTDLGTPVRLWSAEQMKAGRGDEPAALIGHTGVARSVAWSPDGALLATTDASEHVRLWHAETGTLAHCLAGHGAAVRTDASSPVRHTIWSPDGSLLLTLDHSGVARLWETATGTHLHTCTGPELLGHTVAWSGDGSRFAAADAVGEVHVREGRTGAVVHTLSDRGSPRDVRWAPDDGTLLVRTGDAVHLWSPDSAAPSRRLPGGAGAQWSPDGTRLAVVDHSGRLRIWRSVSFPPAATPGARAVPMNGFAWAPVGTRLATLGDRSDTRASVRVWDGRTGEVVQDLPGPLPGGRRLLWCPEGRWLAVSDGGSAVHLWDTSTGTAAPPLTGHTGTVRGMAWSPDGVHVATVDSAGLLRCWDHRGADVVGVGHGVGVPVWSRDGALLALADGHGRVQLRDPFSTAPPYVQPGGTGPVRAMAWSPGGTPRFAVVGGSVGPRHRLRVWDAAGRRLLHSLPLPGGPSVALAWSPDGELIAVLGQGGTVHVWNCREDTPARRLAGRARAMGWSPDGEHLATAESGAGGALIVWDARTGHRRALMRTAADLSWCAWSPAGGMLAAGGEGGLYFFRFRSGEGS
ncbi:eIF2A-related protein [Streptomyces rhizosphaericola]|uniref:eIF2A-related protein n=1 Tax=Streptomyces rhizosphaericola TaxID=2564098 RepID=UPI0039EF8E67